MALGGESKVWGDVHFDDAHPELGVCYQVDPKQVVAAVTTEPAAAAAATAAVERSVHRREASFRREEEAADRAAHLTDEVGAAMRAARNAVTLFRRPAVSTIKDGAEVRK